MSGEPLGKALDREERRQGIGDHARTPTTTEGEMLEAVRGTLAEWLPGYPYVEGSEGNPATRRQLKVVALTPEEHDGPATLRVAVQEMDLDGWWADPVVWLVHTSVEIASD